MKRVHLPGVVAAVLLAGFAGSAAAHTGHGTESFFTGLAHSFGLDHLLAMVAVGLWSVFALPARRAWAGPATFLLALACGALVGTGGTAAALLEPALAASVVMFGVLLWAAVRRGPARNGTAGLGLVAAAAALHGLAHGAEAPGSAGFAGYAAGFMLSCAALHLGGAIAGLGLRRWLTERATQVVGGMGLACGVAGVALLLSI